MACYRANFTFCVIAVRRSLQIFPCRGNVFHVQSVFMVDLSSKFSIYILTAIILCTVLIFIIMQPPTCVYSKMSWCLHFRFGEQFPARIFEQLGEWNGVQ